MLSMQVSVNEAGRLLHTAKQHANDCRQYECSCVASVDADARALCWYADEACARAPIKTQSFRGLTAATASAASLVSVRSGSAS